MFFGATSFSATTFAGVGIQNVTVLVNGKRVNVAIGNTNVELLTNVPLTGNQINLATGTASVITWNPIVPGATGTWVPIDPDNP